MEPTLDPPAEGPVGLGGAGPTWGREPGLGRPGRVRRSSSTPGGAWALVSDPLRGTCASPH